VEIIKYVILSFSFKFFRLKKDKKHVILTNYENKMSHFLQQFNFIYLI